VDYLIPIGGDDTLSYAHRLHREGIRVVGIPKTMDNDVPGTDYCIGFSTCVTRTIELAHRLRTSAGSHERFLVLEGTSGRPVSLRNGVYDSVPIEVVTGRKSEVDPPSRITPMGLCRSLLNRSNHG
jgi:hypothetical protein